MRDFAMPAEIKKLISRKKIRGTIIFFGKKIKHYSSSSSRFSD